MIWHSKVSKRLTDNKFLTDEQRNVKELELVLAYLEGSKDISKYKQQAKDYYGIR